LLYDLDIRPLYEILEHQSIATQHKEVGSEEYYCDQLFQEKFIINGYLTVKICNAMLKCKKFVTIYKVDLVGG